MTILGQGGGNLIQQFISNVINLVKKKKPPCTSTCDGLVLKMHYQWTFWLMIGGFSFVWYSWYHRDIITCVSHFNAETQVRLDYINVCLSYPYVEDLNENRSYLLFYRWVHWTLLVLAMVYYIPRKISKYSDNHRVKKLIEDLSVNSSRYDQSERDLVERAVNYLKLNIRTHNGLFFKYFGCNLLALGIDILALHCLDFLLQGRFIHYGWMAYPYTRDPHDFTDYMSRTFPPFVSCEIGPNNELINKRTEKFGCHLILMELYEKIFLLIWGWMIVLVFLTCLYIVFLCFMFLPYFRLLLLRMSKPVTAKISVSDTIILVLQCCKIGDVYLLYRLRQHLSHARYYELLTKLSDPSVIKTMVEDVEDRVDQQSNKRSDNNQGRPTKNISDKVGGLRAKFSNSDELFIPNKSILVE